MLGLLNNVLEMSKIEAGQIVLNEKSFDLYRLLQSLEEMLRLKAKSKGLTLVFDCMADVPQWVRGDENKLRQVARSVSFEVGGLVRSRRRCGALVRV